jgi:type II secretory pathway predicted ATPase ExeA
MPTNHYMHSRTLFASVLVSQPTLRRMIKPGVLALDQQIAVRYQMTGITPEETGSYIHHHQQLVGHDGNLFSDDATARIHEAA